MSGIARQIREEVLEKGWKETGVSPEYENSDLMPVAAYGRLRFY